MSTKLEFPKNFLWGSATASYQVEGGIENCDWADASRHGYVPECGKACDHYNKYEEDFDLMKKMGHTFHRISIEWARIEPKEGQFDEKEIEHYRSVLHALHKREITPMVTCWHWTLPMWLSEKGGFSNEGFCEYFSRYCSKLVEELGDEAHLWATINEPMVVASHGYLKGTFPPFKKNIYKYLRSVSVLSQAHINAYRSMKAVRSDIRIGIAKHQIYFDSNNNPFNKILVRLADWWWNDRFLEEIRTHQDFIGLNHYHYKPFGIKLTTPRTDIGWEMYPPAIYHCLMRLKQYNVPVYITENGLADAQDIYRAEYITNYLKEVHHAIQDGVFVRGYLYWAFMDNYEWTFSFDKRFGLVEVDFETLERKERPSSKVYSKIIQDNGITLEE